MAQRTVSPQSSQAGSAQSALPPLVAWQPQDGPDYLAVIEREVGDLMGKLAESALQLTEARREQHDGTERLLLRLIALAEEFDDVFSQIEQKRELVTAQMRIWIGNFALRCKRLRSVYEEHGVMPMELVDDRFDPQWHEADETVDDPTKPDGTILTVVKKGYLWHGQLLRKAWVVVTRNRAASSTQPGGAS